MNSLSIRPLLKKKKSMYLTSLQAFALAVPWGSALPDSLSRAPCTVTSAQTDAGVRGQPPSASNHPVSEHHDHTLPGDSRVRGTIPWLLRRQQESRLHSHGALGRTPALRPLCRAGGTAGM